MEVRLEVPSTSVKPTLICSHLKAQCHREFYRFFFFNKTKLQYLYLFTKQNYNIKRMKSFNPKTFLGFWIIPNPRDTAPLTSSLIGHATFTYFFSHLEESVSCSSFQGAADPHQGLYPHPSLASSHHLHVACDFQLKGNKPWIRSVQNAFWVKKKTTSLTYHHPANVFLFWIITFPTLVMLLKVCYCYLKYYMGPTKYNVKSLKQKDCTCTL